MAYKQRQSVYERYAERKFRKALRDQVAPLIDYITEDNVTLLDLTIDGLIKRDPISKAMRDVYVSILPREAVAIAKEVDRNLPKDKKVNGIGFFSSYWKRWIQQAYLTLTSDMITNITETTKDKIRQLLASGREQNLSYRQLAKYMTDELKRDDFTRSRSLTIARTESTRAANIGQQQMAQTSNIVLNKKWEGRDDGRERETHIAASRQEPIPKDEPFIVGGFPMQYPGDRSAPASETVNCYLPDTIIKGNIKGGQKSFYSGQVVEIISARGERLTVTPNHGILTDRGFVIADHVNVGYNLICDIKNRDGIFFNVNKYIDKKISTAANIFSSINHFWGSQRVMATGLDFDGDGRGINGYIHIVDPDIKLRDGVVSQSLKNLYNFLFKRPYSKRISISGLSPLDFFGGTNNPTYRRLVSFLVLAFPRCFGHIIPLNFLALGLVSKINTKRFEFSGDSNTRDSDFLRQLLDADSRFISFDKVVKVRKYDFRGHVYDFSSVNGVNIANNIYTSNCRCSLSFVPQMDADGLPTRRSNGMERDLFSI